MNCTRLYQKKAMPERIILTWPEFPVRPGAVCCIRFLLFKYLYPVKNILISTFDVSLDVLFGRI